MGVDTTHAQVITSSLLLTRVCQSHYNMRVLMASLEMSLGVRGIHHRCCFHIEKPKQHYSGVLPRTLVLCDHH